MIVSRIKSNLQYFGIGILLSASLAFGFADPSVAQNAPLWLLPENDLKSPPPPKPRPYPLETLSNQPQRSGIEAETLSPLNNDSIGVLTSGQGGYTKRLWNGTSQTLVRRLIAKLPEGLQDGKSRVAYDMQRRLLLSSSAPPSGVGAKLTPSLISLRAEKLWKMGDALATFQLINAIAGSKEEPRLNRLGLETSLLSHNLVEACDRMSHPIGNDPDNLIAKTNVLCKFSSGQANEGNFALDLLREAKAVDNGFITAVEVMAGLPSIPISRIKITRLKPEHIAAFNAAGISLPSSILKNISPMMAQAVALTPNNNATLRIQAGEIAEVAGLISIEALKDIYAIAEFSSADLGNAIKKSKTTTGRALIWQAMRNSTDDYQRVQLAMTAIQNAKDSKQKNAVMRLFAKDFSYLQANARLSVEAEEIALVLLANGYFEESRQWMDLLRSSGNVKASRRLWPLYAVYATAPGQPVPENQINEWRSNLAHEKPETINHRTSTVLAVLSGLSGQLPETLWLDTIDAPLSSVPAALLILSQTAALEGRVGGVVMPLLIMVDKTDLKDISSVVLSESVSTLSVVGETIDAQRLGVEAILATGL